MSLVGYWLSNAYSVLGTRICWQSPNQNHFDIEWIEHFNIKHKLYLYPGALR